MREPKRYLIEHVRDFAKVPTKRRKACLSEFSTWLAVSDSINALIGAEGETVRFEWIDDGKRHVTVQIVSDEPDAPR